MFSRHAAGELQFALTTVTIAEVLAGPLRAGEEALRGAHGLKLPDAVQVASALAIGADALVTHNRDFAPVRGLRILG